MAALFTLNNQAAASSSWIPANKWASLNLNESNPLHWTVIYLLYHEVVIVIVIVIDNVIVIVIVIAQIVSMAFPAARS